MYNVHVSLSQSSKRDFVIVNWRETLFNDHLFHQKECLRFETFDELEILESESFLKSDILMSDDSHFKRRHFLKNEIDGEQMSVILLDTKLQILL